MIKCKLTENQHRLYKQYIMEDAESDSQKKAIEYLVNKHDFEKEDAERYVRVTLREKFRILTNNRKVGKFTLGALRLYIEDCKTENDAKRLYAILNTISENNEIGKKYDRNFNGKHLDTLFKEIDPKETNNDEVEEAPKETSNKKYKVYRIDSFEEAKPFSRYVDWCICQNLSRFKSYGADGMAQFYFAVTNDYKELTEYEFLGNDNCKDKYGLSMLAICVNPDGSLRSCTSRWNHIKNGNDHILNITEIEEITGFIFKSTFKPNKNGKQLEEAMEYFEHALYTMSLRRFTNLIDNEDMYPNFYIRRDYIDDYNFCIFNFNGQYNYVVDEKNGVLFKCKAETIYNSLDFIILENKIIYKDNKTDYFRIFDMDTKKYKTLNGCERVDILDYIPLDEDNESKFICLVYKYNVIIYDSDFNVILNCQEKDENFSSDGFYVSDETCFNDDDEEYRYAKYLTVNYKNKGGIYTSFVYNIKDGTTLYGYRIHKVYGNSMDVFEDTTKISNKKIIINYEEIDDVSSYRFEIDTRLGTPSHSKYLIMYKEYDVIIYDMERDENLGTFESWKSLDFNDNPYEDKKVLFAASRKNGIYDFLEVYNIYDDESNDLLFRVKDVRFERYYGDEDSGVEFTYLDSDDNLFIVTNEGEYFDYKKKKREIKTKLKNFNKTYFKDIFNTNEGRFSDYDNFNDFVNRANPSDEALDRIYEKEFDGYKEYFKFKRIEDFMEDGD